MTDSIVNQVEPERVVIATLDDEVFAGTLDEIVEFFIQLRQRFGQDYRDLVVGPDKSLTGVRNYSADTLTKMKQLRELIEQLPEEVTNEVLRNCVVDADK
jgi:hypothetical protein